MATRLSRAVRDPWLSGPRLPGVWLFHRVWVFLRKKIPTPRGIGKITAGRSQPPANRPSAHLAEPAPDSIPTICKIFWLSDRPTGRSFPSRPRATVAFRGFRPRSQRRARPGFSPGSPEQTWVRFFLRPWRRRIHRLTGAGSHPPSRCPPSILTLRIGPAADHFTQTTPTQSMLLWQCFSGQSRVLIPFCLASFSKPPCLSMDAFRSSQRCSGTEGVLMRHGYRSPL